MKNNCAFCILVFYTVKGLMCGYATFGLVSST